MNFICKNCGELKAKLVKGDSTCARCGGKFFTLAAISGIEEDMEITIGAMLLGKSKSKKKAKASRENGKLGGRPKKIKQ